MGRKHKKARIQGDVELNLAAMLDMAFQLLTFFILTFRPSAVEGDISLSLPPPGAVTDIAEPPPDDPNKNADPNVPAALRTLTLTVPADAQGRVKSVTMGWQGVFEGNATPRNLAHLDARMKQLFGVQGTPYDQVIIKVSPDLDYEELLKIIEVCSRQKFPDGTPLSKIGFAELTK